jgi:pimeloyl-ACP methyl ester carboxylesterase
MNAPGYGTASDESDFMHSPRGKIAVNAENPKSGRFWLGLGLGTAAGYVVAQQLWVLWQLFRKDVERTLATQTNEAEPGLLFADTEDTETYQVSHTIEDGIERIAYTPKERRFQTPILMQHGMWHGAWCWHLWQELLAEWGWESHTFSLPGHAGSPVQRPIGLCTLDYYLSFLKAEAARLSRRPVLMGHSMGGALTQWYLKYVGDDLAAAVLVAPWVSHAAFRDGFFRFLRLDPLGCLLMMRDWTATSFIRTPQRAARALISERAVYSPEALHARLTPESALILYQHNPPFWSPAKQVKTPMLWLAGEEDAVISEAAEQRSAAHYGADYIVVEKAGHNLMMEHNYQQTAEIIHHWLIQQGVG